MPMQHHFAAAARSALPIVSLNRPEDLPELMMPIGNGDTHSARVLHLTLIACSVIALAALGWSSVAQVSEVANLTGTLQPRAHERKVAHVDGGVIARVLVSEGEHVRAGQPLVEMDAALARGEMEFASQRLSRLEEQAGDLAGVGGSGPGTTGSQLRSSTLDAERGSAGAREAQQASTVATLRTQLETAIRAEALARDDRDRARRLFEGQATSRSALNQRETALNEASGRVALLQRQIETARQGLEQGSFDAAGVRSRQQLDLYNESNQIALQRTEARILLQHAGERLARLVVRAPMAGVVKSLAANEGEIVSPAGEVAVIVPDDGLIIDARVLARDRQGLREGLPARLRISGFELSGSRWLEGRVAMISPSSFTDPTGMHYYTVRLSIDDTERNRAILPELAAGMEVTGDIVTGHKSVLAYVMGPVRHGLDSALTEK